VSEKGDHVAVGGLCARFHVLGSQPMTVWWWLACSLPAVAMSAPG
jgi:hypothetical protein